MSNYPFSSNFKVPLHKKYRIIRKYWLDFIYLKIFSFTDIFTIFIIDRKNVKNRPTSKVSFKDKKIENLIEMGKWTFYFFPYRVWSSIVIVHEKSFLLLFFKISQKRLKLFWLKKIGWNHGISEYKKALISKHWKNYIFRDNNCFVKMSGSLLVCVIPNLYGRASSKTSLHIKTKFHT